MRGDFDRELQRLLSDRSRDEQRYDLSFMSIDRLWHPSIEVVAQTTIEIDNGWLVKSHYSIHERTTNLVSPSVQLWNVTVRKQC